MPRGTAAFPCSLPGMPVPVPSCTQIVCDSAIGEFSQPSSGQQALRALPNFWWPPVCFLSSVSFPGTWSSLPIQNFQAWGQLFTCHCRQQTMCKLMLASLCSMIADKNCQPGDSSSTLQITALAETEHAVRSNRCNKFCWLRWFAYHTSGMVCVAMPCHDTVAHAPAGMCHNMSYMHVHMRACCTFCPIPPWDG